MSLNVYKTDAIFRDFKHIKDKEYFFYKQEVSCYYKDIGDALVLSREKLPAYMIKNNHAYYLDGFKHREDGAAYIFYDNFCNEIYTTHFLFEHYYPKQTYLLLML